MLSPIVRLLWVTCCRNTTQLSPYQMGPLNPQERTSARGAWRMALCARYGPEHLQQAMRGTYLLDHLVGELEHALLNGEAHLAGNRLVDDQLEAGRVHDRQIGRLGAFQDAIDVIRNERVEFVLRDSVAREAPRGGHLAPFADCRYGMPAQERREPQPEGACEQRRAADIHRIDTGLRERFEGGPELGGIFDGDCRQLEPKRAGRVVDGLRRVERRGVGEHTDTAGGRQQLLQDLELFDIELRIVDVNTGDVTARTGHGRGEAPADQVRGGDDRNGGGFVRSEERPVG